jgi:hypothetical protein
MLQSKFGSAQRIFKWQQWTINSYIVEGYQPVITKKSAQRIFGFSGKSDWLFEFLEAFRRFDIVPAELLSSVKQPLLIKVEKASGTFAIEEGYYLDIFLKVCEFIVMANDKGYLSFLELKIARTAHKVVLSDRVQPLRTQIEEITGFSFFKEQSRRYLANYIKTYDDDAAFDWIITFPDEIWNAIFAFLNSGWEDFQNNPRLLAQFIHRNIFGRLPAIVLQTLRDSGPKRSYRSKIPKRGTGHSVLDHYLNFLTMLLPSGSGSVMMLEQLLEKSFPLLPHTAVEFGDITIAVTAPASDFEKHLKMGLLVKKFFLT